jgi:acyl carrier protein
MDVLTEILFPAVDEARRTIPSAASLERSADSPLFGDGGLDSMGLVRFIVIVEERIQDRTNIEVTLASDKAMSRKSSPFKTLGTLADYIQECLVEEGFSG